MRPADLPRLIERPWQLLASAVALSWLTALAVAIRADVEVGARELVNVVLLVPLSLALAYRSSERIAGAALGAWTLLVWVALPWLAPLYTLSSYDATLRDDVLPLMVGLTTDGGYLEGVALLAALTLLLERRRVTVAAAALVVTGVAVLWLSRLPVPDLSVDAFKANMAGLREYFWSHRVLQWIPIAGAIAVSRRSVPAALALGAWLGAYVLFTAAQPGIGLEGGELFQALLPAFPAYVLLAASLPLLVPTLAARLGPLARPA